MAALIDNATPDQQVSLDRYFDPNNQSSARKYVSAEAVQNNSPTDSTPNEEHIVNLGAGLRSLSLATVSIAEQALAQLRQASEQLRQVSGVIDPEARQPLVGFSESDVGDDQRRLSSLAGAAFDSTSDRNLRESLQRRTLLYISGSRHAFLQNRSGDSTSRSFNLSVPEIEEVRTDLSRDRGAVDNFHTTLLFNLPYDALTDVRGFRVFRAEVERPIFTRPLATLSPAGIQRLAALRGRKNEDPSQNQMALEQGGVPNAVTKLNSFDPFTGLRTSADSDTTLSVPPPLPGQNPSFATSGSQVPPAFARLDKSVLDDVRSVSNIQRNPVYEFDLGISLSGVTVGSNVNVGVRLGDRQQQQVEGNRSQSVLVVSDANRLEFSEIAFIMLDQARSRRVGELVEISYDDETVSYGRGYRYFVVTVDKNLQQSARSQVVGTTIEGLRVPERPSWVSATPDQASVSLSIAVEDQLVEKFEVYRFEDSSSRTRQVLAQTISDTEGFSQRSQLRTIGANNYLLVGECQNGMKTGGQFIDAFVSPGRHYRYRVYSVDVFGNKSESPFELDSYVPDRQQQLVDLRAPALLAEVDAPTGRVRLTFRTDDEHLEHVRIERRDLTVGQSSFSTPGSPPRTTLGPGRGVKGRRSLEGERLYDVSPDVVWNGVFSVVTGEQQVFIDATVSYDHIYQYIAWGEDRYGNRSSYALSVPLLVIRRPFINTPVGVAASLLSGSTGEITSAVISWTEGNLDKSAEDLIGDQSALSQSQVRTMYQVQRLRAGEERWATFPLQTGTTLLDGPVVSGSASDAPKFRPLYPELNQTYFYRVQAVQTGAFISNFSSPVSLFTGFDVTQPLDFVARTPPVYQRPFYVMLNWGTFDPSGVVDRWEIERASVNNFAAARLNLKNPDDFSNISFQPYRTVFRESSRFSSQVEDPNTSGTVSPTIVGEHCFMDTQVDFGNSYFYRIRAVSPEGMTSRWSFKGIKLTSAAFEKKWAAVITDTEKQELTQAYSPIRIIRGSRSYVKSTISMQPEYSKPDSERASPRVFIETGGVE